MLTLGKKLDKGLVNAKLIKSKNEILDKKKFTTLKSKKKREFLEQRNSF